MKLEKCWLNGWIENLDEISSFLQVERMACFLWRPKLEINQTKKHLSLGATTRRLIEVFRNVIRLFAETLLQFHIGKCIRQSWAESWAVEESWTDADSALVIRYLHLHLSFGLLSFYCCLILVYPLIFVFLFLVSWSFVMTSRFAAMETARPIEVFALNKACTDDTFPQKVNLCFGGTLS